MRLHQRYMDILSIGTQETRHLYANGCGKLNGLLFLAAGEINCFVEFINWDGRYLYSWMVYVLNCSIDSMFYSIVCIYVVLWIGYLHQKI